MSLSRLLLSTVLAGSAAFGTAAQAQDITVAVQGLPVSLDPAMVNSNLNLRIMYNLFETLIRTDFRDGGRLVPGLASEWRVIDPRTIEFTLREGVMFHDGTLLNAQDVVATFQPLRIGKDDALDVVTRPFLSGIDRVEVIDDMTVRVIMAEDDAIIANRFAGYPSQIISSEALEGIENYTDFGRQVVGTGPYRLAEFTLGERVVIEAFDDYWGENGAAAETVTFAVTPEISTRIAGLLSGQFDIITEVGSDDMAQISAANCCDIVGGPVENIRGLIFDSTNDVLADPRIREALNLAIDRELLVETLYGDTTSVPPGWQMPIFGAMYLEDHGTPAFDQDRARALLEEAGYDGAPIIYRTIQGYYTNQGPTAQILGAMWSEVGLNVEVRFLENFDQVLQNDDGLMIFDGSFSAYYPDPMGQFWRRFGPNGGWARNGYYEIDAEMIELGQRLATSIDIDDRRAVFAEMLDRFDANPHGAVLHYLTQHYGIRSDRLAFSPLPSEYMDLTRAGVIFAE